MSNEYNKYNPDVLSCLANLSSDEIFTSPDLANKVLDLLPQELFSNPNTKFLDPASKTGIFLREIAKRLIKGLEHVISDEKKRIEHIYKNQIFGIAITEITALLSRRSLYCSKKANSQYSVAKFDTEQGNIRYKNIEHNWNNNKCIKCGASSTSLKRDSDLESHAYEFIHTDDVKEIFNMKFDVIISNPPYQLNDGGGMGSSAKPIYNLFVDMAKKLKPRYISMIIPSRWMTGGKGLDEFRKEMINDKHIKILHDFPNSKDCFSGVTIKGGVCYFLRDEHNPGKCEIFTHKINSVEESIRYLRDGDDDIFIREQKLISIKNKVLKNRNFSSFMQIVSSRKSYGLSSNFFKDKNNIKKYSISDTNSSNQIVIWGLDGNKRVKKYANKDANVLKNKNIDKYKVFFSKAFGNGEISEIPSEPIKSKPGEICTETFLEFGPLNNEREVNNVSHYIYTKFFRTLVSIRKQTQNTSKSTYQYVPMQDFTNNSDIDWTKSIAEIDKQLYKKYNLTNDEIDFIETNISEIRK